MGCAAEGCRLQETGRLPREGRAEQGGSLSGFLSFNVAAHGLTVLFPDSFAMNHGPSNLSAGNRHSMISDDVPSPYGRPCHVCQHKGSWFLRKKPEPLQCEEY